MDWSKYPWMIKLLVDCGDGLVAIYLCQAVVTSAHMRLTSLIPKSTEYHDVLVAVALWRPTFRLFAFGRALIFANSFILPTSVPFPVQFQIMLCFRELLRFCYYGRPTSPINPHHGSRRLGCSYDPVVAQSFS